MTDSHLPLLSFSKTPIVGEKPFDGDYLRRRELAEKLTTYLDRLNTGAVLALDAPWGEGKTWFGKNWSAKLQEDGYKTVYIDLLSQVAVNNKILQDNVLLSICGQITGWEDTTASLLEVADYDLKIQPELVQQVVLQDEDTYDGTDGIDRVSVSPLGWERYLKLREENESK